jgi:hypothetical protein
MAAVRWTNAHSMQDGQMVCVIGAPAGAGVTT